MRGAWMTCWSSQGRSRPSDLSGKPTGRKRRAVQAAGMTHSRPGGQPMSLTTEQLLEAVLALPDEERLEFVEAIFSSLHPKDRPPFDDSWRDVIQRRSAE